jgi:hypothetical protein
MDKKVSWKIQCVVIMMIDENNQYSEANPTTLNYNATSSLVRFQNTNIYFYFEKTD